MHGTVKKDKALWVLFGYDMINETEVIYASFNCDINDISSYLTVLLNKDEDLKKRFVSGQIRVYKSVSFEISDVDVTILDD